MRVILLLLCLLAAGRSAFAAGKLNLFCWSEYVPEPVVKSFEKSTGIPALSTRLFRSSKLKAIDL